MFRLLGGGVAGDLVGLPRSHLAVLPGMAHETLVHRDRRVPRRADAGGQVIDEHNVAPRPGYR
jgi:hypothetical protein